MKLVTNDYSCGTSSSILDYGIEDVIVVSESDYQHVFDVDDDLLFIGHDFLFYLWDSEEKLKRWVDRSTKHEHWLWCFERIDAIVPTWRHKSHISLSLAKKFCSRILACDEDDCDRYGYDWLPQWASCKFHEKKDVKPMSNKVLFSGQAGGPEYHMRNVLLKEISEDPSLSNIVEITNTKRSFKWDDYVDNLLRYSSILNPIGILRGLNTRAYEALYAGRVLLQHTSGTYKRHEEMLKGCSNVFFFQNINELKKVVSNQRMQEDDHEDIYTKHSLHARLKTLGIDIK